MTNMHYTLKENVLHRYHKCSMITIFLKLIKHSLGKFYNWELQTILFTLMEPHKKKTGIHFSGYNNMKFGKYIHTGGIYCLYPKIWHYTEAGSTTFRTRTGNHLPDYKFHK
jgi:hypothetical protein